MTEQGINHNQVEVCGRINSAFEYSHEIFGEGFYTVKLLVNRLSEATDKRLQRNACKSLRSIPFLQQARGES